ncbi:MAG TPA: methyltransferase domain-containing protein [Kofleriaceae bacterium]|nr:methyltransferase domain-containing protein [Kofleriaceae bacterium]
MTASGDPPHDESRRELFDRWARSYDASVIDSAGFPFAGYDDVLDRIVALSGAGPGLTVLDLGTGTGALAARFVEVGCDVIGLDFSLPMLATARAKVPGATFVEGSLTDDALPDLGRRFDRIVSAYTSTGRRDHDSEGAQAKLCARGSTPTDRY